MPPDPTHVIHTDDGCPIAVRELRAGAPSVPVVILIHALAMDGSMWSRVAHALRGAARVLAVDCRGHGRSGKPAGPYTTQRLADDVRQVADALDAGPLILGGCSMGGMVAQAFAGRWPDRVAGLLLVDTTAWYGADAASAWQARATKAGSEGLAALIPFQRERWFSEPFVDSDPAVLAEAIDVFLRNDLRAYAAACRMLGAADERETISRYRGPAAVLVGEHDRATPPAMAADLAARIEGASLSVLPAARHFTPFETPRPIAAALDALLMKTTTGEETP
ncbi:MAG: alpha/beta fold hydrolase [Lautropia sp.]